MLMRIFTLIAIGGSLLFGGMADAAPHSPFAMMKKEQGKNDKKRSFRRASDKAGTWKPLHEKNYGWNGKEWELEDTFEISYDFFGNTVKERSLNYDGETIVTDFSYNENNKLTFRESKISLDGENFVNSKKTEFQYDDIVTNVITMRNEWMWMNDDWKLVGNNYKRTIVRDENGNITAIVIATLFQGYYDPVQRLDITYGEDGKASHIKQSNLAYNGKDYYWVTEAELYDIVWESTDGQITSYEDIFLGNNRIRKATLMDVDKVLNVTDVKYADDGSYKADMTMTDEDGTVEGNVTYSVLENDGYQMMSTVFYPDGSTELSWEGSSYDDWGHLTLSFSSWSDGEVSIVDEFIKGTVEYDADGFPVTYTVTQESMDQNGETFTDNVFRAEYSDYADVTLGVEQSVTDSNAAIEYYSLQGVRIEKPAAGTLCIRRQGAKAEKIIVR